MAGTNTSHPICQRIGHRSDRTLHAACSPRLRCAICGELYGEDTPPPSLVMAPIDRDPDAPGVFQTRPAMTGTQTVDRIQMLISELSEMLPSGRYTLMVPE